MTYKIRSMDLMDINSVLSLQLSIYEDHVLESLDFYLNRRDLTRKASWEAKDDVEKDNLANYPWTAALPPELNVPLDKIPVDADHWSIQDDLSPELREWQVSDGLMAVVHQKAVEEELI